MAAFILSPRVLIIYASLSTYLHIPPGFYNQRPCNGHSWSVQWAKHWFYLEKPLTAFFYFFGVAVRFDWIKIGVWLKIGALNYSSRPKLSLDSAHVKYGVWPRPMSHLADHITIVLLCDECAGSLNLTTKSLWEIWRDCDMLRDMWLRH